MVVEMTKSWLRIVLGIALLAVGVVIWWRFGLFAGLGGPRVIWMIVCLAIALIPWTRHTIAAALDRIRTPAPRTRGFIALGIFVASIIYLYAVAAMQQRDFIPRFHDEFMHLMQTRMLASGRLWMPPHELADFFDTFHILTHPVYASIYFPGAALMNVPAMWLNLPPWVMPLLVAGLSAALLYRVVTELVDGVAAIIAVMLLLSLQMFRFLSIMVMSHAVIVMLGLAVVWAYLNWRRTRELKWAAVLGALCGWAAITRPFDAIAYTLPIAIAVLFNLRALPNMRRRAVTVAVICAAAAPFLALQLIENVGVTGRLFQTPYQLYAEQDSPQLQVGYANGAAAPPPRAIRSKLPQKREFYENFLTPGLERHRVDNVFATMLTRRLPMVVIVTLFTGLLLIVLPSFVLARAAGRSAVMWTMLPIYLLLYTTFPFLLKHYAIVAAPAMCLMVVLGVRAIIEGIPTRAQRGAEVFFALFLAGIALPPLKPEAPDDGYPMPSVTFAAKLMPRLVKPPAIVLFHYESPGNFHDEPVYNIDAAWPDDAPIIRAHDLGPERNRQLFAYYAQRQPQRTVYLFNRVTGKLLLLGNVFDLAHRPATTTATQTTTPP
jgi:hypothetical protein